MSYINIVSLKESTLPGLRRLFPHISFPAAGPDAATLARINHAEVVETEPPGITETQTVTKGPAECVEGEWRRTWVVSELSAEEYAAKVTAAQAAKKAEAKAACEACLNSLGARFPPSEKLTWERQLAEAVEILADAEPSGKNYPWIAGIIAETGETLGAFAQAVADNNVAWRAAATSVIGQRQKIGLDVDAATTVAEVEAIPVSITLPEAG